jgi:hypothetical protein
MQLMTSVILVVVGLVNLAPAVGVLGFRRLLSLYGVPFEDPNALILMRHRAVLFALVGSLLVASAWVLGLRTAPFVAGFVSMLSFVLLARLSGSYNAMIRRIVWIDVAASAALVVATVLSAFGIEAK